MKVGYRVYVIPRKEFGFIAILDSKKNEYFILLEEEGIGFWFRRDELTEGT